ncbi:MAG: Uma2 family endonuclease [Candidatus Schekmanbacteria bacterium]|nr:Uma2 family endonuclease [Candidatus Schekmanbacteria bacterium]
MSTAVQDRLITADEFERIAYRYGRCELIDGRIVALPPAGFEHGDIEGNIYAVLRLFVRGQKLGRVATGEVGCKLPNGRVRAPDVLFVREDRLKDVQLRRFLPFAPDLAVEVVSPDDSAKEVRDKAGEWIAAGSEQAWAVDPGTRTVTVYERGAPPRVLGEGDALGGGAVLPGFYCSVAEIFAWRTAKRFLTFANSSQQLCPGRFAAHSPARASARGISTARLRRGAVNHRRCAWRSRFHPHPDPPLAHSFRNDEGSLWVSGSYGAPGE